MTLIPLLGMSSEALNGDGYYCEPCHVLVEETLKRALPEAERLAKGTHAGRSKDVEFPIRDMIDRACDTLDQRWRYTSWIRERCQQVVDNNKDSLADAITLRPEGVQDTKATYEITRDACANRLDVCDLPEPLPSTKLKKCDKCLAVSKDIISVLTRRKGEKEYLSKAHIWGLLDTECSDIHKRFPSPLAAQLETYCDTLLEDHDEDIAALLAEYRGTDHDDESRRNFPYAVCAKGEEVAEVCSTSRTDWNGLTSPWASVENKAHHEL